MSRDLAALEPEFRQRVERTLARCVARGIVMRPFFTLRSPVEQARLWRQSRSTEEIGHAIRLLEGEGARWLAEALRSVGPQWGREVTNALPGESWHNFGLAVDCFLLERERAVWDARAHGYAIYANAAESEGLVAGMKWTRPDTVHVQFLAGSPSQAMTWREIEAAMKSRFGGSSD